MSEKMECIVIDPYTHIRKRITVPMTKEWYETLQNLFREEEDESRKL